MTYRPHNERTELTVQLLLPPWPESPSIGVVARLYGELLIAASGVLPEPHTNLQMLSAVRLLTLAFLEPGPHAAPAAYLHQVFQAVTEGSERADQDADPELPFP